ncbi:MAG: hypothetical protein KBT02_03230 [Treponema sp.]|nr:hypothetical protein [Candidatus Treponema caballi]
MAVDIGPRIGVDGEAQFRKDLKNISQSLKTLGSEMKVVTSEFDGQTKSAEQLKRENDVLERSVLTLKDKLKLQEDALEKCARQYGEADEKTMKWQQAVNETRAALNKAENEIKSNTNAMRNLGNEADDVSLKTSAFSDKFKNAFNVAAITAGLTVALNVVKEVGAAIFETAQNAAEFADEINTLSTQTGIDPKLLQEFKYLSELLDVDVDTFTGSMAKLVKNMNTARKGTGDAAIAFEKLGISITESNGELRNNQDVFFEVIDALGQMANETERDAMAMAIFGKSAQDLNPLIEAGAEALARGAVEAERYGRVYSDEEREKLNNFNDSLYRLKNVFEGFKTDFIVNNIDMFSTAVDASTYYVGYLRDILDEQGLRGVLRQVAEDAITYRKNFTDFGDVLINLATGPVGTLINGFRNLKKAIEAAANAKNNMPDSGDSFSGALTSAVNGVKNGTSSKKKSATSKTGGATFNINPRTMSKSDTDYVVNYANRAFGGSI